ncbi:MAG: uroporphyrinogen-III synthase [Roseobacter sp.]
MTADQTFLILTRPAHAHAGFLTELSPATRSRLTVVSSPLMEIAKVEGVGPALGVFSAVFTSANGVRFAPPGQGQAAFCVGRATTDAACKAGWMARCLGENADALIETLLQTPPTGDLVHFSGQHQRGDIVENLRAAGINAARKIVYDQVLLDLSEAAQTVLVDNSRAIVPLFSPRTAAHFARQTKPRSGLFLIALSEAVASVLPENLQKSCSVARTPTAKAVATNIEKLLAKDGLA